MQDGDVPITYADTQNCATLSGFRRIRPWLTACGGLLIGIGRITSVRTAHDLAVLPTLSAVTRLPCKGAALGLLSGAECKNRHGECSTWSIPPNKKTGEYPFAGFFITHLRSK